MKIELQYVSDMNGNPKSVQLPISDWERILKKLNDYEQFLKIRSDLKNAYKEVEEIKKSKAFKQTLNEFLDEL
jgi:hypothetical protein